MSRLALTGLLNQNTPLQGEKASTKRSKVGARPGSGKGPNPVINKMAKGRIICAEELAKVPMPPPKDIVKRLMDELDMTIGHARGTYYQCKGEYDLTNPT